MKMITLPFRALTILLLLYTFGNGEQVSVFKLNLVQIESNAQPFSHQQMRDISQVDPDEELADEDETNFTILWCIGIFIVLGFLFAIYEVAPSGNRRKYNDTPF